MELESLPDAFTWLERPATLDLLMVEYVDLLGTRLGELLGRLTVAGEAAAADQLGVAVARCPAETLERCLAAPEVSYRLLWPSHHTDVDAAGFVRAAVEAARRPGGLRDRPGAPAHEMVSGVHGSPVTRWPHAATVALDATGDYARLVDVTGDSTRLSSPGPTLDDVELAESVRKLNVAAEGLKRATPIAWGVVCDFTEVVVLLPDPHAPTQFSSGTTGQYVGRSTICNPHLEKVGPEHLAEALVHEAVHAVLYQGEQLRPWVLDDALYAGPMRIPSPWTQNPLPLRPYLQACFVWYSLFSLWSVVLTTDAFDPATARERLATAVAGFLRGPLLEPVEPVRDRLDPELLRVVHELQARLVHVVGSVAPRLVAR